MAVATVTQHTSSPAGTPRLHPLSEPSSEPLSKVYVSWDDTPAGFVADFL